MTNFRLFQTERVCRQQFPNFTKMAENYPNRYKTLGKGDIARYEQCLLFQQCFQKVCFPGASKGVIVWEWVNPLANRPLILCVCSTSLFFKTVGEREKLLIRSNFPFPTVFSTFQETVCHFHQVKNCLLQTLYVQ